MDSLLLYLYHRGIHSNDPHAATLCKGQTLKIYMLKQEQLDFYSTLLVRNILAYSAANMELKLSNKHLVGMYRLYKFENIFEKNGVSHLLKAWVGNDLMPVSVHANKIPSTCSFIYIDYKEEPKVQQQIEMQAEPETLKKVPNKSKKQKTNKKQTETTPIDKIQKIEKKQTNTKVVTMVNVLQLTLILQNKVLVKQLEIKEDDPSLKNSVKRAELIEEYQQIKIDEYINQRFNTDTLMTLNFIKKNPFIDEKTLLSKTMLSAAELRKCLGGLTSEGFVNFYPQNSRSMLFRAISKQRLKERVQDHIAQTILNLYIFLDKKQEQNQQKTQVLLSSVAKLDDILMIFMA